MSIQTFTERLVVFTKKKNWFTVSQAAEHLRIGETTVRKYINAGCIEYVVVDNVMRLAPWSLKRFVKGPRYQKIKYRQKVMLQQVLNRVDSGEVMEAIKAS